MEIWSIWYQNFSDIKYINYFDEQKNIEFFLKKISFSGHSVTGESEYKFLEYIDNENLLKTRYYIYSKDNDFIILLLQYLNSEFIVVLEGENGKYWFIDIIKVREYLIWSERNKENIWDPYLKTFLW